jgi:hypothetical protein
MPDTLAVAATLAGGGYEAYSVAPEVLALVLDMLVSFMVSV